MKVLMTYDYRDKVESIRALGYEVFICAEQDAHLFSELAAMDLLVCYNPFDRLSLSQMPNLKAIFLSSIGIDQLPREEVINRSIQVANNRGGYSPAIAEWILFRLLEIYKMGRVFDRQQQDKIWKLQLGIEEISDKVICFIGAGSIAVNTCRLLKPFGSRLIGLNTSGKPVEPFEDVFPVSQLDHILTQCDALIITVPYTDSSHHLLTEKRLESMKDTAVIINVSRGRIIEETGLVAVLGRGKFKGVALDVFEEEPLPADHPLWQFKQVHISPHNSWVSQFRNERRFETLYENMKAYIQNKPLVTPVDVLKGY